MGYYTIWLASVKSFFVPFWELGEGKSGVAVPASLREIQKPAASKTGPPASFRGVRFMFACGIFSADGATCPQVSRRSRVSREQKRHEQRHEGITVTSDRASGSN